MSSTSLPPGRGPQIVLIGSLLGASWLGMQIVHELGHVLAAWATGGTVVHVELKPWTISRTDVWPNPRPLIVAWAGPLFGVLLPVGMWLAAKRARRSWDYLPRFFAGFCLVANGTYIGCGVLLPVGDAADMLREWPAGWPLGLFGLATVPAGLALWHGLGERFGFGSSRGRVEWTHAAWCAVLFVGLAAGEMW